MKQMVLTDRHAYASRLNTAFESTRTIGISALGAFHQSDGI